MILDCIWYLNLKIRGVSSSCSWTKTDLIHEEEMVAEMTDARNLIEIQLEQELGGPKKQ